MKHQFMKSIAILAIFLGSLACNQTNKNEQVVLVKGEIKGIENGTILRYKELNDPKPDKYKIDNGKFEIELPAVDEPTSLSLGVADKDCRFGFYVENGTSEFVGELYEYPNFKGMFGIKELSLKASVVNDHQKELSKIDLELRKKHKMNERGGDIHKKLEAYGEASKKAKTEWVKAHSNTYYAAYVAAGLAHGADAKGVEEAINLLDPKLDNSIVRRLKEKLKDMKATDVDPSKIIKASNVAYMVERTFKGAKHKHVSYLGIFKNDNVCTLNKEGVIQIIDSKGKEINRFKPELVSLPTSIAVDEKDEIYVMYPIQKEVEKKVRGRVMKFKETAGFECAVFDAKGKQLRTLNLPELKTATGARVANSKLMIADWQNKIIGVFNSETGKKEAAIEDMRPCCMILDFSINDKNEVLVANLGAYRVQAYDLTGKQLLAFGKRGKSVNDFHGCCNPVSVAYLSNGAIVTVEKDPTRVKIYSNEGAKAIEGIQELVQGCSYIPMIVDSKDNLYLASPEKGMIKCVSKS